LKEQKLIYYLTPLFLHILTIGTLLVIGVLGAYIKVCLEDGFLSQREISGAFEYFFTCITELLLFNLAFDVIYKYEKKRLGSD